LKVVVVKVCKSDRWQVAGDEVSISCACGGSGHRSPVTRHLSAFTLLELLVVIAILGILAGLSVPALKNLGKSNATVSASRQLLDDVGRARQMAMAQRTTVYMVFVPTNFWNRLTAAQTNSPAQWTATVNLCDGQLTGYTFMSFGNVGDQPGRHSWHYLAPWQSLPDGTFIAMQKFGNPYGVPVPAASVPPAINILNNPNSPFNIFGFITNAVPFPVETNSVLVMMPCIIFNSLGQLVGPDAKTIRNGPGNGHEYIPLARGSVVPAVNPGTKTYQLNPPSVTENPPGNSTDAAANIIDIDPLTGRAVLQFFKIQ
jgi:prepilin-type N-terminal cleavage/methylation domain-containing protein